MSPQPPLVSLTKYILEHPENYEWSLQGFGMLRTYFGDEVRLHIWNSDFAEPGANAVHDHPWNFESWIVAGRLLNQRFSEVPMPEQWPEAEEWNRVKITPGPGGGPTSKDRDKVWLVEYKTEIYHPGQHYSMTAYELHRTQYDDGTVTIIERNRVTAHDEAVSLWQGNGPWPSAEPRPATPAEVQHICREALRRWYR